MRNMKRGPAAFAEDKGFYIILFLCIAAIAISGYVLFFTPAPAQSEPLDTAVYEPTVTPEDIEPVLGTQEDIPVLAEDTPEPEPQEEPTKAEPSTTSEPVETPAAVETVTQPSAPAFVRPVAGEISEPYSGDELIYQATFGDWRTHTGADYTAELGARVYAITDGSVTDVFTDGLYGTCVTLSHADGLLTTYKGLGEDVKVKTGQTVKAGDVLGVVDDSNLAESAGGPHLHVEASLNGERIDPESLLKNAAE